MTDDPLIAYPPMMTVEQVGEVLQVQPRTLFEWRKRGSGPPYARLGDGHGSSIRYPREELRKYMADRVVGSARRVAS